MSSTSTHDEHRDDIGSNMGMWMFIFSELLFFSGLFIVYAVFRSKYHDEFHLSSSQLNVFIGSLNTVLLMASSMTITMAITAMQKHSIKLAQRLTGITILLGIIFLVNKYFEWGHKIEHHIYPGSDFLMTFNHGEIMFFGLYYFMTGLHALHIIVGLILLIIVYFRIGNKTIHPDHSTLLENTSLYWHLVDLIWIFLFPLLYLIN